jgi:rhamnose transport system permease protein
MKSLGASRWLPYLVPSALLIGAALLVSLQAGRPWAVLEMWRPWGEIGALAAVMTAIVLTGGIDLSVGSIVALASVTLGLLWQAGCPVPLAATATVAVGLAAGCVNGALVLLGAAPLVATLATMGFYAGLAMALSRGQRVSGLPAEFTWWGQASWLGVPHQVVFFLVVWLGALVVVHHTRFGRYLYAIGDNPLAARFAAVPLRSVQFVLYAASGVVAACVAILYTARGGAAVPTAGTGMELQAIACVVVGGTRVTGGWGGLGRTLVGVATLSLLDIGLQFVSGEFPIPWSDEPWRFSPNARLLLVGFLLIAVAVWNERARMRAMGPCGG